ncbi:MAG TPA: parallel beta-helix domain-containing protein, partial [Blastocatellia bacterium]|nr:parallel beta-helix domain-containing protein [Blastocatellia bacterium]
KVPTLRNVALNPPYMHNGRFKDLIEVLDFYAGGGGPGKGFPTPHIDDKIRPFTLSDQEKRDMVAFLSALTDESKLPSFPERVPSGLPVVGRLDNPARAVVSAHNTGSAGERLAHRAKETIRVSAGESIQAAVSRARAGDTIEVSPGVYHEEIFVDLDNITLRGLGPDGKPAQPQTADNAQSSDTTISTPAGPRLRSMYWPVLNGEKKLADAVIATGSNFVIEGFEVRDYVGNGIQVQNAVGPVFRDLMIDNAGLYGVYPVSCTGVTVERVTVTRIADAGIYVGQSRDIVVRNSVAHGNVTGIEIENSVDAVVEDNLVYDNTGGILVFVLPNNPSKVGRNCRVANNRVFENNHPNFGNPSSIVGQVPPGGGIFVMAADETEVTGNEIRGNNSYGVAVMSLTVAFPKGTRFDVGPLPERNRIHDNVYADNGREPSDSIRKAGLTGADLLWDLSGWSNTWQEKGATRATPLLSASWPSFARRAYWRTLSLAQRYL